METNAIHSLIEHLTKYGKNWTIDELAKWGGIGGVGPVFVGSAATVAEILQERSEETCVDGFNLAYAVTPDTFEDVVNLLAPELQKRGVYPISYKSGTLREKLFGDGPYLGRTHPAHGYRDIEAVKAREAALFELTGSRSTLKEFNLDRHWRNARTHTLHDTVRYKYVNVGNYYMNGVLPPRHGAL